MMQNVSKDAERTRRELSKMDLEHVRIERVMGTRIDQPAISAH